MSILKTRLQAEDIIYKRSEIKKRLLEDSIHLKNETIRTFSTKDLHLLFQLYDQIFFENWFKDNFKGKIKFSLSRKMTKSAGITRCPKNIAFMKPEDVVIELKIGVDLFFQYDEIEGSKTVCGITTNNSLEALLLVFEHELCHVLEFLHYHTSKCSGKRFKTIAGNWFGHTESYHKLPTQKQITCHKLGIKIGETVSFTFEGKKLSGILYAVNKRATVMVPAQKGLLTDKHGNRYSKYYVPLALLNK